MLPRCSGGGSTGRPVDRAGRRGQEARGSSRGGGGPSRPASGAPASSPRGSGGDGRAALRGPGGGDSWAGARAGARAGADAGCRARPRRAGSAGASRARSVFRRRLHPCSRRAEIVRSTSLAPEGPPFLGRSWGQRRGACSCLLEVRRGHKGPLAPYLWAPCGKTTTALQRPSRTSPPRCPARQSSAARVGLGPAASCWVGVGALGHRNRGALPRRRDVSEMRRGELKTLCDIVEGPRQGRLEVAADVATRRSRRSDVVFFFTAPALPRGRLVF